MARRFTEKKLVIASHNKGKIKEIGDLLAPFGIEVFSAGDLDLPEPEETEKTFIGNAQLKSTAAAKGANLPALADDSGLAVSALDGAPGIYSARWAGPDKDFDMAMERSRTESAAIRIAGHRLSVRCHSPGLMGMLRISKGGLRVTSFGPNAVVMDLAMTRFSSPRGMIKPLAK